MKKVRIKITVKIDSTHAVEMERVLSVTERNESALCHKLVKARGNAYRTRNETAWNRDLNRGVRWESVNAAFWEQALRRLSSAQNLEQNRNRWGLESDAIDIESPGLLIEVKCEIEVDVCTTWVRLARDRNIDERMKEGFVEGHRIGGRSRGRINGHGCTEVTQNC